MSHWNHRIVLKVYPSGEAEYSIREVHYKSEDDSNPVSYSANPQPPCSDTPNGLKWYLEKSLEAFEKPTLFEGQITEFEKNKFQ